VQSDAEDCSDITPMHTLLGIRTVGTIISQGFRKINRFGKNNFNQLKSKEMYLFCAKIFICGIVLKVKI
jgi:hypothetical protein